MKKLAACLGLVMAAALGGCTFYFGENEGEGYSYCDDTGCYTCTDDGTCWNNGGGGWGCSFNEDCAAGCYCDASSGQCIEAGFCDGAGQCPDGLVCDYRASCVPDGPTWCAGNDDCAWGTYCDPYSGQCLSSTTCEVEDDCPVGQTCANGTCAPELCSSDEVCAAGCYCDPSQGCVETGFCSNDNECPEGQTCDEGRSTCIPGEDPPPPPPACEELTTEADCEARAPECREVWSGYGCTDICSSNPQDPGCTCEGWYYAGCETAPTPSN